MNSNKKLVITAILATSCFSSLNAAVQINYKLGSSTFFTKTDNSFFTTAGDDVFLFYGSFENANIPNSTSTPQKIKNDFKQLGRSSKDTIYSGTNGEFSTTGDETARLGGQRGYLIVTNNSDIASATEMAIITNSSKSDWTFANDLSGAPNPSIPTITSDDAFSTGGGILLGTADKSGTFDTIRLQSVSNAVPEPSSFALFGIGVTAFLFRRRK